MLLCCCEMHYVIDQFEVVEIMNINDVEKCLNHEYKNSVLVACLPCVYRMLACIFRHVFRDDPSSG